MASPLPAPKRYITTTSPTTGQSSHLIAAPVAMEAMGPSRSLRGNVWLTERFPAEVAGDEDVAGKGVGMISGGSSLRYIDFAPQSSAGMHFTASIDYGIVLTNAIVHETSDKETVTLNAGDVIVQRGTLHAWHNRTDQWTRMIFVMIPSEKVVLENGEGLTGTQYS